MIVGHTVVSHAAVLPLIISHCSNSYFVLVFFLTFISIHFLGHTFVYIRCACIYTIRWCLSHSSFILLLLLLLLLLPRLGLVILDVCCLSLCVLYMQRLLFEGKTETPLKNVNTVYPRSVSHMWVNTYY